MQSIRSASCRITACIRQIHSLSRQVHPSASMCQRWSQPHSRPCSTAAMPLPQVEGEVKEYAPKIQHLVEEIGSLTLLEVADLNELLKKTLNISDAPMMAMGAVPMGAAQAAETDEVEEEKHVQTQFAVKLLKFDEKRKVALIKEIKLQIEGMNLVQAKKFVESAPQNVRADIQKDEAEKLKAALEAVGATVEIE